MAAQNTDRVSRATKTESVTLGTVRLIDVGDSVENLDGYLEQQAQIAANQRETCILVAALPRCPGCAALGHALRTATRGASLPPTRVIRVDIEEFEQELEQLGLYLDQVPVFALLDDKGSITKILDVGELPSNAPADFLPVLSNFILGRLGHRVGGSFQGTKSDSVEL